MKKINYIIAFLSLFLVVLFYINFVDAEWGCSYSWEISQCIEANKSWTTRSIEDFVCIVGTSEEIAYQVVLDKKFKELDEEMDEYIVSLEEDKDRYFWKWSEKNYIDWINEIDDKRKEYYEKYSKICWEEIIKEVIACNIDKKTSNRNAKNYFQETDCMSLINKKLEIFDNVTYNVLKLNKKQVKTDDKKTYDQKQRENYDKLLDDMMKNSWYMERIWKKWPSKIKDAR